MSATATLKAILGLDVRQYKAAMRDAGGQTVTFQKQLNSTGKVISSVAGQMAGPLGQVKGALGGLLETLAANPKLGLFTAIVAAALGTKRAIDSAQDSLLEASKAAAGRESGAGRSALSAIGATTGREAEAAAMAGGRNLDDVIAEQLARVQAAARERQVKIAGQGATMQGAGGVVQQTFNAKGLAEQDDQVARANEEYKRQAEILASLVEMRKRMDAAGEKAAEDEERRIDAMARANEAAAQEMADANRKADAEDARRLDSELERLTKRRAALADAQGEIDRINQQPLSVSGQAPQADQMARMGLFVGAQRPGLASADRQLELGREMAQRQRETNEVLRRMDARLSKIEAEVD